MSHDHTTPSRPSTPSTPQQKGIYGAIGTENRIDVHRNIVASGNLPVQGAAMITHKGPGNGGQSLDDLDNHANQCNPNNDEYWHSRGEDERPDDWQQRSQSDDE